MPLPSDERIIQLSNDLIAQFEVLFGAHPGFRPAHAKGVLLKGSFTPSAQATSLTRAPHAARPSTPVTVRFSNATGIPIIPDNDPNADPRGMAIRFHLADRVHTDIVAHSADGFPTRTGQELLEFLRAVAASGGATSHPTPVEQFLGTHPATLAFVQTPHPSPTSFAKEQFYGVTAMRFINREGVEKYGRYRIVPAAGIEHLSAEAVKAKDAHYLFDELGARIAKGPVRFGIEVQIAEKGDVVDDSTILWPSTRPLVPLGTLELTAKIPQDEPLQQHIIFDPIPRVDGIEPSNDPLIELRAAAYLVSGRRRRHAPETQAQAAKSA